MLNIVSLVYFLPGIDSKLLLHITNPEALPPDIYCGRHSGASQPVGGSKKSPVYPGKVSEGIAGEKADEPVHLGNSGMDLSAAFDIFLT